MPSTCTLRWVGAQRGVHGHYPLVSLKITLGSHTGFTAALHILFPAESPSQVPGGPFFMGQQFLAPSPPVLQGHLLPGARQSKGEVLSARYRDVPLGARVPASWPSSNVPRLTGGAGESPGVPSAAGRGRQGRAGRTSPSPAQRYAPEELLLAVSPAGIALSPLHPLLLPGFRHLCPALAQDCWQGLVAATAGTRSLSAPLRPVLPSPALPGTPTVPSAPTVLHSAQDQSLCLGLWRGRWRPGLTPGIPGPGERRGCRIQPHGSALASLTPCRLPATQPHWATLGLCTLTAGRRAALACAPAPSPTPPSSPAALCHTAFSWRRLEEWGRRSSERQERGLSSSGQTHGSVSDSTKALGDSRQGHCSRSGDTRTSSVARPHGEARLGAGSRCALQLGKVFFCQRPYQVRSALFYSLLFLSYSYIYFQFSPASPLLCKEENSAFSVEVPPKEMSLRSPRQGLPGAPGSHEDHVPSAQQIAGWVP